MESDDHLDILCLFFKTKFDLNIKLADLDFQLNFNVMI